MKIENREIYICEFCERKMFGKGAMSLHERQCKSNPKNRHKCFQYCRHLEKGFDSELNEVTFKCNMNGEEMYSYKLEHFSCQQPRIDNLTRMPLECELYEVEGGHIDLPDEFYTPPFDEGKSVSPDELTEFYDW